MDYFELYESEQCLVDILRNFGFLRHYGYRISEFWYWVRAYPGISFKNSKTNQIISIIGSDLGSTDVPYSINIERRKLFSYKVFAVEDCYNLFGSSLLGVGCKNANGLLNHYLWLPKVGYHHFLCSP